MFSTQRILSPDQWTINGKKRYMIAFVKNVISPSGELKTDQLIVNLGPHHPSTHGVFRMAVLS
jgi:hypothetical protein